MFSDEIAIVAGRMAAASRRSALYLRRRLFHARPFADGTAKRLLILSVDERIPQSQIHPFLAHSGQIAARFDTQIREIPARRYLAGRHRGLDGAGTVCFQTRFDISPDDLARLLDTIRSRNPGARLVYLDWFAPTDLRLAERLDPHVALYVKKHMLADPSLYGRPTLGDTNLTDHFARRFGLDLPQTLFRVPQGFAGKLVLGPSFVTADFLSPFFHRSGPPASAPRPIDLHARIATGGSGWYQAMRGECAKAAGSLDRVHSATGTGINLIRYLREMRQSKICFSPFGYGEVCWRDFEAVASGAVLLKPDMAHVRTDPDIFVPYETYMPVAWDLSDFAEKIYLLLGDNALRTRLAGRSFEVLRAYVASGRFTDQMARLFGA